MKLGAVKLKAYASLKVALSNEALSLRSGRRSNVGR